MKLRLSGTEAESAAVVDGLAVGFVVRAVSGFYPNRGSSVLGRVVVDAAPLDDESLSPNTRRRVRATATRTDQVSTDQDRTDQYRRGLPGGPRSIDQAGGLS